MESNNSWISEYEKLLFIDDELPINLLKLVNLKAQNMPKYLYKYRTPSSNSLEAFRENVLYLSFASEFNDIHENFSTCNIDRAQEHAFKIWVENLNRQFNINIELSKSDFESLESVPNKMIEKMNIPISGREFFRVLIDDLMRQHEKYVKAMTEGIQSIGLYQHKICCFSEDVCSTLMWTHYSANNEGFCIEFETEDFGEFYRELLFPVIYSNNIIDLNDELISNFNYILTIKSLTQKAESWSYEKEWRLVLISESDVESEKKIMPKPKSIYLGLNISEDTKAQLTKLCEEKGIKIYQMVKKFDSRQLGTRLIYE